MPFFLFGNSARPQQPISHRYGRSHPDRVLSLKSRGCVWRITNLPQNQQFATHTLNPEPNLFGRNPREAAEIEMWSRRMELTLFGPFSRAFQNTSPVFASPVFASRIKQFKDYGTAQLEYAKQQLRWLDGQLKGREFIAGSRYTMADIHALTAMIFAQQMLDLKIDPALKELTRWHATVSSRPSAKA